jgi:hypothetical protein
MMRIKQPGAFLEDREGHSFVESLGKFIEGIIFLGNDIDLWGVKMSKYPMSKTIGMILGAIMIIATFGYGLLYILGTSLGKALGSEMGTTAKDQFTLVILIIIGLVGVITGAGSYGIKFKGWRFVYIGFCLLIGVILLFTFYNFNRSLRYIV